MNRNLEHPIDRWKRLGFEYVVKYDHEDGFSYTSKRGHVLHWMKNPVTMLNKCDVCGKTSTPKKVHIRNDVWRWNCNGKNDNGDSKDMLCTSCWNKIKPIVKREKEADETKRFINKLERVIRNERKNQNDRANARISGNDDDYGGKRRA